jgi:hypothetical protein
MEWFSDFPGAKRKIGPAAYTDDYSGARSGS